MHSFERGGSLAPTERRASSRGYGKAGRHDRQQTAQPKQRVQMVAVASAAYHNQPAAVVVRNGVRCSARCFRLGTRGRRLRWRCNDTASGIRHSFIISTSGTRTKRRKSHHHPHDHHHVANEEGGSSEISDDPAKTDEHVCTQTTQQ